MKTKLSATVRFNLVAGLLTSAFILLYAENRVVAQSCTCSVGGNPSGTELIVNGNFSSGNTGFTSSYNYHPAAFASNGDYGVGPNPSVGNGAFVGTDHTTGTGNFLYADASLTANTVAWSETVTVTPNTDYVFEAWACLVHVTNPAELLFSINSDSIAPGYTLPNTINQWNQFCGTWNSGSATTAVITIINKCIQFAGNDFGLDDISFKACSIGTPPHAALQSSDTDICATYCIDFTNQCTNATSWLWKFPGGKPDTSTAENPKHICYLTAGSYDVTLIGYNASGHDSITLSNFIKVNLAPLIPVLRQSNDTIYCGTRPSYTSYQWYDSAALITNATDTFYVATHGGNYNVKVTNENGCTIAGGINVVLTTSMEEEFTVYGLRFTISPNPVKNQLGVTSQLLAGKKAGIEIYNLVGKKVYSGLPTADCRLPTVLDVSFLAPGIYFVQLQTEGGSAVRKFVKE